MKQASHILNVYRTDKRGSDLFLLTSVEKLQIMQNTKFEQG